VAVLVAKFTAAETSSSALSFFSTRAAHAAHVIPRIESSTSLDPGADAVPVVAADIEPLPPSRIPGSLAVVDSRRTGNLHRPGNGGNAKEASLITS
jgi:hypothetical protein